MIVFGLIGLFSDVEANEEPAFEVVLKADKKRLHLLEEVSFSHTLIPFIRNSTYLIFTYSCKATAC